MDCSLAAAQHQHQQQQQQQQQQNSVNCLDESIRNLTLLAGGGGVGGSPLKCVGDTSTNSLVTLLTGTPPTAATVATATVKLRKYSERCLATTQTPEAAAKSQTYRISMANLEETQESELDVILGELSLLEAEISCGDASFLPGAHQQHHHHQQQQQQQQQHVLLGGMSASPNTTAPSTRTHSRTNSTLSATTLSISGVSEVGSTVTQHSSSSCSSSSSGGCSENGLNGVGHSTGSSSTGSSSLGHREPRTESPDNDSAFSDTVSLLSSESSASSSASSALHHKQQQQQLQLQQQQLQLQYMQQQYVAAASLQSSKAAKIQLALHKLEHASIRRLFVKAFTADGASKSLLVDERMTCGHVTRLLADKNHVQMQPNWALVENLGDLQMERLFEDHELLVDKLMTWNSDAGNRVLFQQRADKVALFVKPEIYLPGPQMAPGSQHDEHTRAMLLEEFFETNSQLQVDGPLYMKADSKKGWKRYHFVLRASGLYYFPKEKTKNTRDLACLTLFNGYNVYRGLGWKKKWKAPTDYTFGFKSTVDSSLGKTCRTLKMLCAEDLETMEKWVTAIRISTYGKQLWDNHKALMEDLNLGSGVGGGGGGSDTVSNSSFAVSMRSESISSISSAVPSQCGSVSSAISSMSNSSGGGRISRASSSSSSGCLSDDNNGFDSEFTTGTIKRKPSMKPNLPLTTMTRQLKEVGEITICGEGGGNGSGEGSGQESASPERSGTLTRRHSRRKSQESNGSGTLKRRQPGMSAVAKRGSAESMNTGGNAGNSSGSSNSTPTPTPSICAKPLLLDYDGGGVAGATVAGVGMSSSTLSLDSLPPPPPPPVLLAAHEQDLYGSQLSLASLPPPPPPEEVVTYASVPPLLLAPPQRAQPPAVPAKPVKPVVKLAPPYKAPPDYSSSSSSVASPVATTPTATTAPTQKKVSFADSPVLLRRKMCSPEPRCSPPSSMHLTSSSASSPMPFYAPGPLLPPRGDATRFSNCSSNSSSLDFGSPKRLQESASNPPRDFLKDLQRVMRKKWQVAQKCKLEPATTPHEVLGFRDFSDELLAHNLNSSGGFYRETANVSNWVQEHYGAGAPTPPVPPLNEYALYENLHSGNGGGSGGAGLNVVGGVMGGTSSLHMEPQFPIIPSTTTTTAAQRKKRPPPPPPKRSDSTHLTHRV